MAQAKPSVIMSTPVPAAEADRRLRPVLDALFRHNTKQALKLTNQALQKRPGWPAARALHACILLQTEKWDEGRDEVLQIRADIDAGRVPIDEDAANKLQLYYQETRQEHLAAQVYEQAWHADKNNLRLAEIAYALYVRSYAFSDGQKISAKLHRHAASRTQKYVLWPSVALWLQLTCTTPKLSGAANNVDDRMSKLLCAMVTKALDATSTPTAEAVRFASKVYVQYNDHKRAYNLISHPRLVMDEAEVLHLRASLPTTPATIGTACTDYEQLLSKYDADDWAHWLQYFECKKRHENWIAEAKTFVDGRIDDEYEQHNPRRGPFLARIELLYRENSIDQLLEAITAYFSQFGSKTTCAHDIRPYLALVQDKDWLERLFAALAQASEGRGCQYRITLSWLNLWHNRLEESPETLFSLYKSELSRELEPTDRQAGDDYILLAVHKLLPMKGIPNRYADSTAVARSIVILEAALTRSPFNFHFKLLLILLYTELGAMERVTTLWESLEVRHIQIATLSHLVLVPFFETGYHDSLQLVLEGVDRLWGECDREVPECVSKAFQAGSVNAAVEFINFRVRLENSAVLARAMIIEALHELVSAHGDSLGTHRALSTLTVLPRFTADDLQSGRALIANEDTKTLEFWELDQYDPNRRLLESNVDAAEQYTVLKASESATVCADLQSLTSLLRLAQLDNGSVNAEKVNYANIDPHCNGTIDGLARETDIRIRIASNLSDVKHILRRSTGSQSFENNDASDRTSSAVDTLEKAKLVSKDVFNSVEDALQDTEGLSRSSGTELSPKRIRRCGRIVFDTLIVTTVAISSLGRDLAKDRKRMKKLLVKTGDGVSHGKGMDFKHARDSVLAYREAILSACTRIQEWISNDLERDSDWAGSWLGPEEDMNELFAYLPDAVDRVELSEGQCEGSMKRVEFIEHVLSHIRSSHDSCAKILETLAAISQSLKLADF